MSYYGEGGRKRNWVPFHSNSTRNWYLYYITYTSRMLVIARIRFYRFLQSLQNWGTCGELLYHEQKGELEISLVLGCELKNLRYIEVVGVDGCQLPQFLLLNFLLLNNKNQRIFLRRSFHLDACCLTILICIFIMFKGATRPCHIYVFGF